MGVRDGLRAAREGSHYVSVKLYRWAWAQDIAPTLHHVLLAIVERADNKTFECHPSQSDLASMTKLGERTVRRALDALEDIALIERERRNRNDGSRSSDRIRVLVTVDLPANDDETYRPESHGLPATEAALPATESTPTGHSGRGKGNPSMNPSENPSMNPDRFDEFYAAYPRKTAKAAARKAWAKAIKTTDPDVIITATHAYAEQRRYENPKYTPYPATWLNAGQWDDEPDQPTNALTSTNSRNLALVAALQAQEAQHDHHQQVGHRQAPHALERRLPA